MCKSLMLFIGDHQFSSFVAVLSRNDSIALILMFVIYSFILIGGMQLGV